MHDTGCEEAAGLCADVSTGYVATEMPTLPVILVEKTTARADCEYFRNTD